MMPRYEKYKDSGIEWLGEIPEHWEVKRLKDLAKVVLGKMLQNNDSGSDSLKPYLRSLNVQWEKTNVSDVKEMWFSDYEMAQYRLREYDIVVSEGGEIGRAAIWKNELGECYIQNSVHKVTCLSPMNHHYLLYQFVHAGNKGHFDKIVNRVSIAHLTREKLVAVHFVKPPKKEQNEIADYLNKKLAKLDKLIKNKEDQIEKLKAAKEILISKATTQGLEEVEIQQTDLNYIVKTPKHWELKHLKRIANVYYGLTLQLDHTITEGTPIISLPHVSKYGDLNLDLEYAPVTPLTKEEKEVLLLKKGDLLFNWRNGSKEHVGKTAYFDEDGEFTHVSFLLKVRFNPAEHNSKFFYYFFNALRNLLYFSSCKGMVNNTFNKTELENLRVCVPPKDEQDEIAKYLDDRVPKYNQLINQIAKQVEKLKEIRKIEIFNAVTGKINCLNQYSRRSRRDD